MKVGILTFPGSPSYGAALQMFALYDVLSEKCEVEIINYIPKKVIHRRSVKRGFVKNVAAKVYHLFIKDNKQQFSTFESQIKKFPEKEISTTEELKEIVSRYDRVIVGSDQVWNPVIIKDDMNYFLEFCDHDQKASYAPSFGSEKVEQNVEKITELLGDFKYLCVREERGAQIIKELIGKDVPVVLDPTLLRSKTDWIEQIKKARHTKKPYVLYFTVKPSESLIKFAEKFSKENGYELIVIGSFGSPKDLIREKIRNKRKFLFGVGPAEFLSLVNDAAFVMTNSFHGTAFSIIFEKEFYVEFSSDTNSRLENIIDICGLEKRVISKETSYEIPELIDYANVGERLNEHRLKSSDYLEKVIGE